MIKCKTSKQLFMRATLLALLVLVETTVSAQSRPTEVMRQVEFEQRIGQSVPLDAHFRDSSGARARLGDYFNDKPVILTLVYYECPMLCTLELNGLVRSLKMLKLTAGEDFQIVTVSFDPGETPAMGEEKRKNYLAQYGRDKAEAGWQFLTGDEDNIEQLCQSVGFRHVYDGDRDEYAHASGIVVLTPEGQIARYFYGIDYPARDLRLSLVEASAGELGTAGDQLLLLCYGYDPATGKYGLLIMNVIRLGAVATVIALGTFIATSLYVDLRRRQMPRKESAASQ